MSRSSTIVPVAKSVALSTSTTIAVANVATGTNTFYFQNVTNSQPAYVGVFSTYAAAAAATAPVAGTPGVLVAVSPNTAAKVSGNFGTNPNPGTVYVAAITTTGTTTTIATPVAP